MRAQAAATCEWTKSARLALASLQRPIERNESDLVRIWMGFRRRASSSTCCAFAAAAIADVSARAQINRPISARRHSNQSSRRPGARWHFQAALLARQQRLRQTQPQPPPPPTQASRALCATLLRHELCKVACVCVRKRLLTPREQPTRAHRSALTWRRRRRRLVIAVQDPADRLIGASRPSARCASSESRRPSGLRLAVSSEAKRCATQLVSHR